MLRSSHVTSINFADTFAHSLISIIDAVKRPLDLSIKAFITQGPTPNGYSCGFPALAGYADATLRFLQAIEPTHCLSLVDKTDEDQELGPA